MANKKKNKNSGNSDTINDTDNIEVMLSDVINKSLNSSNSNVSYFLNTEGPVNITDWVASGSSLLDIAMANIKHGGFPAGRISEITGLEASGKSLLAAHALANTQKKGGIGVYLDVEQSVSKDFLEAIGVDISKLVYANIQTIEDVFEAITQIINKIKSKDSSKLTTIVVDSVAATTTQVELGSDFSKDGYATDKSIIISKAMRKITDIIAKEKICLIFTNQLRTKMNAFGDPFTTSGGKAIGFHASIRIRLTSVGKIKDSNDKTIGISTKAEVFKNKIAPPFQVVRFPIYFDRGIDDYESWLLELEDKGVVTKRGAWNTFVSENTGEEIKFQKKDFVDKVLSSYKDEIYEKLSNSMIHTYKHIESDDNSSNDIKESDE